MSSELSDVLVPLPEIVLAGLASLVLIVDVFQRSRQRPATYYLAQLSLLATMVTVWATAPDQPVVALHGTYIADTMAVVLKLFLLLMVLGVFVYGRRYLDQRGVAPGEFHVLGLFGALGMMILVSAHSFLTLYLGLELMALSIYAMVALHRDSRAASEAAMKYFVLGALASGMLLYGISILYGATGSLDIATVGARIGDQAQLGVPVAFALTFIVVGLAFKFGAVPFHMWVPDIYDGAPTAVTLYLGSAPKIAAFGMAIRLLADAMGSSLADWSGMLVILSVLSMGLGNLVAIAQTNIKRMLAYSTISHVGFIFLGILAGTAEGYGSAMFYALTYALMSLGSFGMIILLSRRGFEADRLDDFKGLNARHPWFAAMMLILMFSLAGVPPLVGFYAKLAVLQAVVHVGQVWLAAVAVLFSVIGAFYYLRVVKLMYFDAPEGEVGVAGQGLDVRVLLSLNALAVLGLGLFPGALLGWCMAAFG